MDGRIIGGENTAIEEIPYQVILYYTGKPYCGGSIIASQWILTAAHCLSIVPDSEVQNLIIRAGTSNLAEGGSFHKATLKIKHYDFGRKRGVIYNDIGLVKVITFVIDFKIHDQD